MSDFQIVVAGHIHAMYIHLQEQLKIHHTGETPIRKRICSQAQVSCLITRLKVDKTENIVNQHFIIEHKYVVFRVFNVSAKVFDTL